MLTGSHRLRRPQRPAIPDDADRYREAPSTGKAGSLLLISQAPYPFGVENAEPASRTGLEKSFAENAPRVLLAHLVGDAFTRETNELGERRVRPTVATRQRRNQAGQRGPRMTIEVPEVDGLRGPAGGAAHPQEPMP